MSNRPVTGDSNRHEFTTTGHANVPHSVHLRARAPGFCALVVLEPATTIGSKGSFGALCLLTPLSVDLPFIRT